jgi:predicted metal-binding membrane protein
MTLAIGIRKPSSPGRLALFAGLGAVMLAAWGYLALMIREMSAMAAMPGGMVINAFSASYLGGLFVMWVVMQAAMMLPSALPMIHGFTRMQAAGAARPRLLLPAALFGSGYLVAWSAFSLGAALLQAGLTGAGIVVGMKVMSGPVAGGVLIAAGLYQWLPFKHACLRRCRTPMGFLMTEWREGRWGPLVMGWRHGLFCVGCCWALMGLLFTVGVMNPLWIAAIAVYVLLEKVVPYSEAMTRFVGVGLVLWGAGLVVS